MITFRTAKFDDAESLSKLVNSAYRGDSSRKGWTTEADVLDGQRTDPEKICEMISDTNSRIVLAETEHQILGCVYVRKEESYLYFGMLTVNPEIQAQGIGKMLLTEIEKVAKEWNRNVIRLTVIGLRKELIEFYMRRGYQETGKTEPFPESDPRFGLPKQKLIFKEFIKKLV